VVKFDKKLLTTRLKTVGPIGRMLFAWSCAERLFPLYESFCEKTRRGRLNYLRSTLDHLWELALSEQTGHREPFLDDYESLIPGEDDKWTPLNPLAENAVAAVAYACQCQLDGKSESAVWAGVQSYEAVDYLAHTLEGIDFNAPQAEAMILSKDFVQAEIERQLRDLAELQTAARAGGGIAHVGESFRERAKSEGMTLEKERK